MSLNKARAMIRNITTSTAAVVKQTGAAAAGAAQQAGQAAQSAAQSAATTAKTAAAHAATTAKTVATSAAATATSLVGGVRNAIQQTTLNFIEIVYRPLTFQEIELAKIVYGHTIPYDRVRITAIIGLQDRAFVIPGSLLHLIPPLLPGGAILHPVILATLHDKYLVNMGLNGVRDAILYNTDHPDPERRTRPGVVLIHELAHVWQGHNGAVQWSYLFNALFSQTLCRLTHRGNDQAAYSIDPVGQSTQFNRFNAEQQATIAAIWHVLNQVNARGRRYGTNSDMQIAAPENEPCERDWLFNYIRDNFRTGQPNGHTRFLNTEVPMHSNIRVPIDPRRRL